MSLFEKINPAKNTTLRLKSKRVGRLFQFVNQKWDETEVWSIQDMEDERKRQEEEIKAHDEYVESVKSKMEEKEEELRQYQPIVDEQERAVEAEVKKLNDFLKVKGGIEAERDKYAREYQKGLIKQDNLDKGNKKLAEDLKVLVEKRNAAKKQADEDAKKAEEEAEQTVDLSKNEEKPVVKTETVKKQTAKTEKSEEANSEIPSNKLAKELRSKMLNFVDEFGVLEGKLVIDKNVIQFNYELVERGGTAGLYFFTISTNISEKDVDIYKLDVANPKNPPNLIANGIIDFHKIEKGFEQEVVKVAESALKKLESYRLPLEENPVIIGQ